MFKKPKNRNFRQRARDSESEEENREQDKVQEKLSATKLSSNIDDDEQDSKNGIGEIKKPIVDKMKAKLSFHDDEEEGGDVFKVKKSSYSRRMAKQVEKDRRKQSDPNRKENQKIEPKKKIEVKEEPVESSESIRKRMERERLKDDELNVVWVKSESMKKAPEPEPTVIDIPAEDPFSDDSDDEDGHTFRSALQRGVIPDAKTIYALKKQRQQRRDADEFIPLHGKEDSDNEDERFNSGKNCAGDDDDEEDEDGRIDFVGIEKAEQDKEKSREEYFQDSEERGQHGSGDEDDELSRWEREQIKKGLGGGQQTQEINQTEFGESSKKRAAVEIPSFITQGIRTKVNLDQTCDKLRDRLAQSKEELQRLERDLVNIGIETMQAEEELTTLTSDAKRSGREFEFYQILNNYIASQLPP